MTLFSSLLDFDFKKQAHGKLLFLDVLVEIAKSEFFTSVYCKPFLLNNIHFGIVLPPKLQANLIGTLVNRTMSICSKSRFPQELDNIKTILRSNGYPVVVIHTGTHKAIIQFSAPKKDSPQKCPVYLKFLWIGNTSLKFKK